MAYLLRGTKTLMDYRRKLGRPCTRDQMANAVKKPIIYFEGLGKDSNFITLEYGEKEAQALAAFLGVTVSDVTTNGGQEYRP